MLPEWQLRFSWCRFGRVIYARISSDREADGLAVARQLADCRRLAERKGWSVVEEYVDDDVSAWSGRERPEYARMLADLRRGRDRRRCWSMTSIGCTGS